MLSNVQASQRAKLQIPFKKIRGGSQLLRLFQSNFSIYVYPDGNVEFAKNTLNGLTGTIKETENIVKLFSRIIADHKIKNSRASIFKEAMAQEIEKAVNKIIEGDYNDRTF